MPTVLEMFILALAAWRISSLLANEKGPGDSLEHVRLALGMKYDEEGAPVADSILSSEAMCQWCNSLWIGLAWAVFYYLLPTWSIRCALPFALSTATILIMTSKGLQVFLRSLREGH